MAHHWFTRDQRHAVQWPAAMLQWSGYGNPSGILRTVLEQSRAVGARLSKGPEITPLRSIVRKQIEKVIALPHHLA